MVEKLLYGGEMHVYAIFVVEVCSTGLLNARGGMVRLDLHHLHLWKFQRCLPRAKILAIGPKFTSRGPLWLATTFTNFAPHPFYRYSKIKRITYEVAAPLHDAFVRE